MKQVKVSYAKQEYNDYDFGLFAPARGDGVIKVDKELWDKYVIARAKMESLHWDLVQKLPSKIKLINRYDNKGKV